MADGTAERGIEALLARLPEASDEALAPEVRELLARVSRTLRVPFAGVAFRRFASDPPFLAAVWDAVGPALGTRLAEREADRLRLHALYVVPHADLGAAHRARCRLDGLGEGDLAAIARIHETVHYAVAKLLLAMAIARHALDAPAASALSGLAGRGGGTPAGGADTGGLEPIEPGHAPSAVRPEPVAGDAMPARTRRAVEELRMLHRHPFAPGYFRALARWPGYLERVRDDLAPLVGTPRYRAAAATLATLAEVAARGLAPPWRLEPRGELGRDEARALLAFFHERLFPDLLIDAAYLRALLEGERRARTNPLSLTA